MSICFIRTLSGEWHTVLCFQSLRANWPGHGGKEHRETQFGKKKKAETSIGLVEGVDGYTEVEQPESI